MTGIMRAEVAGVVAAVVNVVTSMETQGQLCSKWRICFGFLDHYPFHCSRGHAGDSALTLHRAGSGELKGCLP